jgi:uncharacterized protein involved in exopolysaccharide biosynthesis
LAALSRQRDQELNALKLDMNAQLGRVDRTITQEKDLFTQLAKSFNQATMAKGQLDFEDVRVGAPAVANSLPLRRGRLWKAALAAFAGGLVGIGVAVVRDADREARGHRSAHAAPADVA